MAHGLFYMENAGGYKPVGPAPNSFNRERASAELFRVGRGKGRSMERQRDNKVRGQRGAAEPVN